MPSLDIPRISALERWLSELGIPVAFVHDFFTSHLRVTIGPVRGMPPFVLEIPDQDLAVPDADRVLTQQIIDIAGAMMEESLTSIRPNDPADASHPFEKSLWDHLGVIEKDLWDHVRDDED